MDGTVQSTLVVEGDTNLIQVNANIGRASIVGLQGQVQFQTESEWRFRATYNVTRGRDAEGRPLSHIPPAFGACTAARSWTWLTLNTHLRWSAWKRVEDYGPGSTDNRRGHADGTPAW